MSSRKIICGSCAKNLPPMHPEDVSMGYNRRVVQIVAKKPADHGIKTYEGDSLDTLVETKSEQLSSLVCDHCGHIIPDGDPATATTLWRGEEPESWEQEYTL
jgi:hypothetical protein